MMLDDSFSDTSSRNDRVVALKARFVDDKGNAGLYGIGLDPYGLRTNDRVGLKQNYRP